jgi:hypothetical protein
VMFCANAVPIPMQKHSNKENSFLLISPKIE